VNFPSLYYAPNHGLFQKLKGDLEKLATIERVSFSESIPGTKHVNDASVRLIEEAAENSKFCYIQPVSPDYFATYKVDIVYGTVLTNERPGDEQFILLNEMLVKQLGIKDNRNIVGRQVSVPWQGSYQTFEVIGVVKDYHHESMKNGIQPCVYVPIHNNGYCHKASIRISPLAEDSKQAVLASIEEAYRNTFPYPFEFT